MERNTIELMAHMIIKVDEITAIKLAGPICTSGVVCTDVNVDVSALEETINILLKGSTDLNIILVSMYTCRW